MTSLEGWLQLVVESINTYLGQTVYHSRNLLYLVLQGRTIHGNSILEVLDVVSPAQLDIKTRVKYLTCINNTLVYTNLWKRSNLNQEVFGSLAIPVNTQGKTVVKETSIKT